MIDTDSDPDLIDLPIPGNDDAMRAVEIICKELADSIIDGKQGRADKTEEAAAGQQPRKRSSRAAFRADDGKAAPAEEAAAPTATAASETPATEPQAAAEPVAAQA